MTCAQKDDGAGNPYIIKPDGKVMCYSAIDDDETEVADTLLDFWSK